VNLGKPFTIKVKAADSSKIHYFVSNSKGETVASGINSPFASHTGDVYEIMISAKESSHLDVGANTLKIFISSDEALRPDTYTTSFLVTEGQSSFPDVPILQAKSVTEDTSYAGIASIIIGVIIVGAIVYIRRKRKKTAQNY